MKNREYFLRDDIETYKVKYLLLCNKCEFKINKFGSNDNLSYICKRINILEV